MFHGKHDLTVKVIEIIERNACEQHFLPGENMRGLARYPGSAEERRHLVIGELWPRANQAHIAAQHVEDLRKLVEFPAAQDVADGREPLIDRRRDFGAAF